MFYKYQYIKYLKKNYFEEILLKKVFKFKFKEKMNYVLIVCEFLDVTLLDLVFMSKIKENKILTYFYYFIYNYVNLTFYINNFIFFIFYKKYKNYLFKNKKLYLYMSLKEFFEYQDTLKMYIELSKQFNFINKKSKRFIEYNVTLMRLKFLFIYMYDIFYSIEYLTYYFIDGQLNIIKIVKFILIILCKVLFLLVINIKKVYNSLLYYEYIKSIS